MMQISLISDYLIDLLQKLPSLDNLVFVHLNFITAVRERHDIVRLPIGIQVSPYIILTLEQPIESYLIIRSTTQTIVILPVQPSCYLIVYANEQLRLGMLIGDLLQSTSELEALIQLKAESP
ncbi:hypothetical protein [Herpetosiphon sp. NSE202]|uniref:hypothetical protein n=1 Tax=Herpetosiphon sp. NSE202 TaxID=3351349 RepID=UPI00364523A9